MYKLRYWIKFCNRSAVLENPEEIIQSNEISFNDTWEITCNNLQYSD